MTQLQVDFNPAVVATDYVHEVISTSYLSNNLRTLFMNHTIEMTSILSVVSCVVIARLFLFLKCSQEEVTSNFTVIPEFCPPGYVIMRILRSGEQKIMCSCDQNDKNIANCRGRQILLSVTVA